MATSLDLYLRQQGAWEKLSDGSTTGTGGGGTTGHQVWGSATGPNSTTISDSLAEFNRQNAIINAANSGTGWTYRRSYSTGTEATAPSEPAGVRGFRSCKPSSISGLASGQYDSVLTTWLQSMDDGALATVRHEPENDTGMTAALFDAGFNHFAALAKSVAPNVLVGPVLMEFRVRTQSGYSYGQTINTANIDFWGLDIYDGDDAPMIGFKNRFEGNALPYFRAIDSSKPWAFGEIGVDRTARFNSSAGSWGPAYAKGASVDMAAWVIDMLTYLRTRSDVLVPMYYNVDTARWKLTDAEWQTVAATLP